MNVRASVRLSLITAALLVASTLTANTVAVGFDAALTSGSLAGTDFMGSFSYDGSMVNPTDPEDFVTLLSFDFDLDGVHFSRSNITQGGQAIFHFGQLFNQTAAFFPQISGPASAPLLDIAFGFGGPGVIGYVGLDHNFGAGSFTVTPEPRMTIVLICVCVASVIRSRCSRVARCARHSL